MDAALESLGWTEDQWNRICNAVTEEAQKARVAAQLLPLTGPEPGNAVALPSFKISSDPWGLPTPPRRLSVDSDPTLHLTTISLNVQLRSHDAADPDLNAALAIFRRAANYVARIEDALIFHGRTGKNQNPPFGLLGIPSVFTVSGDSSVEGIFRVPWGGRYFGVIVGPPGQGLVSAIVAAVGALESRGQLGPYACVLGNALFEEACDPNANFVLPRDRILPFLQGPLLRSSAVTSNRGAIVALSGSPVELVIARDISVQYLQTTLEPRYVFRVSERVALRIKEEQAIALLRR